MCSSVRLLDNKEWEAQEEDEEKESQPSTNEGLGDGWGGEQECITPAAVCLSERRKDNG